MIPGDLLSAFPHRQFHTLPGLLDSWAALPNSNPNACMPMQGGSLYHFYDGLWYDPAERRTHDLPCERRTCYRLSQPDTVLGAVLTVNKININSLLIELRVFYISVLLYFALKKPRVRNIRGVLIDKIQGRRNGFVIGGGGVIARLFVLHFHIERIRFCTLVNL